jgi:hypothetical protein
MYTRYTARPGRNPASGPAVVADPLAGLLGYCVTYCV